VLPTPTRGPTERKVNVMSHLLESARLTAATPLGEISYLDRGDGPVALFVHGIGTNALLWRNVIELVSPSLRCVAIDLPLHGLSPFSPDQDVSLGSLADIVLSFVDALGVERVDLVGHDTGGAVAQIFAARYAHRLSTLTLLNCDTQDNIPPAGFQATVDLARTGSLAPLAPGLLADLAAAREAVFAMGYEHADHPGVDVVRSFLEPVLGTPDRARQFERMLSALEPDDLIAAAPALAQLDVPTLIVWGTADSLFDVRWAYWLQGLIPGATEVIELAGARLFFPDERADELVPLLMNHWSVVLNGHRDA
jgi:pimeloyl-ACP methyl ester carboxylesterase